ncbi:MAG: YbjQ family protein [Planctomycetota bacterium]
MWIFLLQFAPILILLLLAIFSGTWVEKAHFKKLERREAEMRGKVVVETRHIPPSWKAESFHLVHGEVVIGSDYFKTFSATLKNLVGGNLRAFESLMERARREALLRMMEQAHSYGANTVFNVRFESSNIGAQRGKQKAAMVEMYAYGTAFRVESTPEHDRP